MLKAKNEGLRSDSLFYTQSFKYTISLTILPLALSSIFPCINIAFLSTQQRSPSYQKTTRNKHGTSWKKLWWLSTTVGQSTPAWKSSIRWDSMCLKTCRNLGLTCQWSSSCSMTFSRCLMYYNLIRNVLFELCLLYSTFECSVTVHWWWINPL